MRKKLLLRKILLYCLLLAGFIVILHFWYGNVLTRKAADQADLPQELGRLAALTAVYLLMVQVLLIGRVSWIERSFGLDRLTIIHHLNATLIISLLIAHPLLLTYGYAESEGRAFIDQYRELLTWQYVIFAAIGLGLLILIGAISYTPLKNRLKYEKWYSTHLFMYLVVLLTFPHQLVNGNDFSDSPALLYFWCGLYLFSLGNLVGFRFIKPLAAYARHHFTIERIERESDDVVSLYIGGAHMDRFTYEPGQFVMVRFLARSFWLEAHPFSLSLPPGGAHIRISIKNSGDFTARVPQLLPGTHVLIDGPHGVFTPRVCDGSKVLLMAGGIGITPIRAVSEAFIAAGKEVVLLYSTRKKGGIVFKEELDSLAAQANYTLHYVVSDEPSWAGEKGRIDKDMIIRLVPDAVQREVFVCGPPPMMMGLVNMLSSLGVEKNLIHYERFSL